MNPSITRRLLGSSSLAVCAFLGLAGISLDAAHRESTERAMHAQLQAHIYTLLATAQEDRQGRPRLPDTLSAPAFNRPDSGLYAKVRSARDGYRWRSRSLLARDFALAGNTQVGTTRLEQVDDLLVMEQGIGWEDLDGNTLPYMFSVAMDTAPLVARQSAFRTTLWSWLGGAALVLLLLQLGLVRWGLAPLYRIARDVREIEEGSRQQVGGPVPQELHPLAENLNSLIRQGQARHERLRHSLADLAHSLKTPLAVLRGASHAAQCDEVANLVDEQVERIDEIISYHRQRAAVAGRSALHPPLLIRPVLQRIIDSLHKVHRERALECSLEVGEDFHLRADHGDLFELFGNLLENAFKHAHRRLWVHTNKGCICIEDDGEGIAAAQVERLLRRGERADERHPGQGIGLSLAHEIVAQYDGALHIDRSPLGGARVSVCLPHAVGTRNA